MIIVIEGPDGAGKTTLAKDLAARYTLAYHHEGPPPTNMPSLWHYASILDAARGQNIVIDRFALGERVYGPVLRGKDTLGPWGWRLMQRLMRAVGAVQILCLPPYEWCHTNWAANKGIVHDEQQFQWTYDHWTGLQAGQIVYSCVHPGRTWLGTAPLVTDLEQLDKVLSYPRPTLPAGMVGSPIANVLLVGDRGADLRTPFDLPFFSTSNSSQYLNEALFHAHFQEKDIALINAFTRHGFAQKIPAGDWKIIALGKIAAEACKAHGLQHETVPHPQHWKRFCYHDIKGYAKLLNSCR